MKHSLILCVSLATLATSSNAATFTIIGGQTNIDIEDSITVQNLPVTLSVSNVVTAATIPSGFDLAFPILNTSTSTGETGPFSFTNGSLFHSGSARLTATAFLGQNSTDASNLTINSIPQVVDAGGTNQALFNFTPTSATPGPGTLVIEGNLTVTAELSTVLVGNALLTGLQIGTIQIDAITVPEPSSILLSGLAAIGFLARRRR